MTNISSHHSDQERLHRLERRMQRSLRQNWKLYLAEGALMVALGIAAVTLPNVATLAVDVLIGWLLFVAGIYGLVTRVMQPSAPGFWLGTLLSVITAALGALIAFFPAAGILTLSMALTAYFIAHGIGMVVMAISVRPENTNWGWLLLAGLVDFALAALVLSGWPTTATWLLGLYVGLNLVLYGLGLAFAAIGAHASDET